MKTCGISVNPVLYRALLIGNSYSGSSYLGASPFNVNNIAATLGALGESTKYTVAKREKQNFSGEKLSSAISSVFAGADSNDVSLFYYTGHGNSNGGLVGQDYAGISPKQLRQMLDSVPGRKIVFADSCYSGKLIGRGEEGNFEEAFLAAFTDDDGLEARSDDNLDADDYFVIAASKGSEISDDWISFHSTGKPVETRPGWGNYTGSYEENSKVYLVTNGEFREVIITGATGVLTRSLVRGLGYDYTSDWASITKGDLMADTNGDNKVTFTELCAFIKKDVSDFEASPNYDGQTPTSSANSSAVFFAR